jgi:FkbM family methyltransferase
MVKIVDVGANPIDGEPSYGAMLRAGAAQVVGFEPNPEALAALERRKGPNETYLPHAVGDGGRHTLHYCSASGMTSLLEPDAAVLGMFHGFPEWGRVVATETVDTVRLDDVAETEGADLLTLDIQGAELMALRNGTARLQSAVVVQVEVEFMALYAGQPLFSDVDIFLRGQGYLLHKFWTSYSRVVRPMMINADVYAGLSQLVWGDALFVRDWTRPETYSDLQLLKAARILHDCYQSADVVLRLLGEYDRRTGGGLAEAYFTGLGARLRSGSLQRVP